MPSNIDYMHIEKHNNKIYIYVPNTQLWGEGETIAEADKDLLSRKAEYEEFCSRTKQKFLLAPIRPSIYKKTKHYVIKTISIVFIVGLTMYPISYMLSNAVERTMRASIQNVFETINSPVFTKKVTEKLQQWNKHSENNPEAEKLLIELDTLIKRIRPYTSRAATIFIPE